VVRAACDDGRRRLVVGVEDDAARCPAEDATGGSEDGWKAWTDDGNDDVESSNIARYILPPEEHLAVFVILLLAMAPY
jgi:hypothetical protein